MMLELLSTKSFSNYWFCRFYTSDKTHSLVTTYLWTSLAHHCLLLLILIPQKFAPTEIHCWSRLNRFHRYESSANRCSTDWHPYTDSCFRAVN